MSVPANTASDVTGAKNNSHKAVAQTYSVGDRVTVKGHPHMEGQKSGTVKKVVTDEAAYGILFDDSADMGVHKWYLDNELKAESTKVSATGAVDYKGQYLGNYIEGELVFDALYNLVSRLYWGPAYDALYNEEMTVEERVALMGGAIDELKDYTLKFIQAVFSTDVQTSADATAKAALVAEIKSYNELHAAKDAASLAEATMVEHTEAARAAAEGLLRRVKAIRDVRLKEGRTISSATSERLQPHAAALKEIAADIEDLISGAASSDATEPEIIDGGKAAATLALQAQALELEIQSKRRSFSTN